MSVLVAGMAESPAEKVRRFRRPAVIAVFVAALVPFLFLAQQVIDAGYLRRDIAALQGGEAWRTGGWISQLVLRLIDAIPGIDLQQRVLSLVVTIGAALLFALLYHRLRRNGWFVLGAIAVPVAIAVHAEVLYAVTASSRGLPIYFALAVMVPAIRQLEDAGDVQATIAVGLLMPLLLLASPVSALLIVPFALGAALSDSDARRDPRAFLAMLLVAILPSMIVGLGVVGFVAQARMGVFGLLLPYLGAYGQLQVGDIWGSLLGLAAFAPVMLVPLLYCVWPNVPEERRVVSALSVVAIPVYLAIARQILNTTMPIYTPPVTLLALFGSWLCVARLPLALRVVSVAMLAVSVVASWTLTGIWDDAEWRAALLTYILRQ